jgi:NAD(P)H-dependent FMN reductase
VRTPTRILAISGSLRAASTNTALLRAAALVAPEGVEVTLYEGLAGLPPFNPDLDQEGGVPCAPAKLRRQVAAADGLLIACPEYAHGVPGAFKNALDWLVGDLDFPGKPVALLNAAPRARHAQAALAETLRTMSARLVSEAPLSVPVPNRDPDPAAIVADPQRAATLRAALALLTLAADERAAI